MSFAARRPYACPVCGDSFTKWSICQNHVNGSACGEILNIRNQDQLQEMCRAAKPDNVEPAAPVPVPAPKPPPPAPPEVKPPKEAWAAPEVKAAKEKPKSPEPKGPPVQALKAALASLQPKAKAASSLPAGKMRHDAKVFQPSVPFGAPGLQATPVHISAPPPPPPPRVALPEPPLPTGTLDADAWKLLQKAAKRGFLQPEDMADLEAPLKELATSFGRQRQMEAIRRFLKPGFEDFRWIADKAAWLRRCSGAVYAPPEGSTSARELLAEALGNHGLRLEALSEECWNTYDLFPEELQENVVTAVRQSLAMKAKQNPSQHFAHLCVNEEAIYNLEARGPEETRLAPTSLDSISDSLYCQLLRQTLVGQRNAEEQLLQLLAEDSKESLLQLHLATAEDRCKGSAEVLSLLHAAASANLVPLCSRCIAEGFEVNERAGLQQQTALQLAATGGALGALKLLLAHSARPELRDADGRTALHHAASALMDAQSDSERQLQMQICQHLTLGLLEADERDTAPAVKILPQAQKEYYLRLRDLQARNEKIFNQKILLQLGDLHCDTLSLLLGFFDAQHKMQVPDDALPLEFAAVLRSEFVQEFDKLRRRIISIAKELKLSETCQQTLLGLPLAAVEEALKTFQVEELSPELFAPVHVVRPEEEPEPRTLNLAQDRTRIVGRLRKWESERGFGFIVTNEEDEGDGEGDIFVHRTNLMGSGPGYQIDLRENCMVSYVPGVQDGRARAMHACMVDDERNVDPVHLRRNRPQNLTPKEKKLQKFKELVEKETHPMSRSLMEHLATPAVQELIQEKRLEGEAFLRCLGLLRQGPGRRDDALWKKEIERRVEVFLDKKATPLQRKDFDFRVRRFLTEFCMRNNAVRVSEALAMVEKSTSGKSREGVRSWPAYVATLLRRFDPEVQNFIAERERKAREPEVAPEQPESGSDAERGGSSAFHGDGPEPAKGGEFAFQ